METSTSINLCLLQVTQASKVWGEVPLPEDLVEEKDVQASPSLLDDDEDFAADEASGGGRDMNTTNHNSFHKQRTWPQLTLK